MTSPLKSEHLLTFAAVIFFYFFEFAQMSYFNALAPDLLRSAIYTHHQIGSLSAAYYYGNVLGLLPAGFILDHMPLRKMYLLAILGSVLGAALLAFSHHYSLALTARLLCGFFGGTFSFIGGMRVLAHLFAKRFSLFMGIFLTSGMMGGLIAQYPLLWLSNHFGPHSAIVAMLFAALVVFLFNLFAFHPNKGANEQHRPEKLSRDSLRPLLTILKNYRNWFDCVLIIFLDSPFTILGTLWGIVTLTNLYHFSTGISALIMTLMFAGSIVGSLFYGIVADRWQQHTALVTSSTFLMCLLLIGIIFFPHPSALVIAVVFLAIGLLTGSQTIVFTWLIKNMRPDLIGRNSAMNSMLLMGAGGLFKQICAGLLVISPFIVSKASSVNLLLFIAAMMLLASLYGVLRHKIFTKA